MVDSRPQAGTIYLPPSLRRLEPLRAVVARLARELEAEEIWLFGSRAEGRERAGSDYDLLAVLPDDTDPRNLEPVAAWQLVRGSGLPVDVVPCTRGEFEDEKDEIDSLPRAAFHRGICVYMSIPRRVRAYLDLMEQDIEAAELLAKGRNRYAAYHVQQSLEKLVEALLLRSGTEAGVEHRLDVLIGRLGEGHAWVEVLRPLEAYSPYATSFRYPTPGGRVPAAPDPEAILADIATVRELLARARQE